MNITFAPGGILQIDNARIVFRNFSGAASKYNRAGDRNFALVIDDQNIAERLIENGWNVKIKPPREDGDIPFMYLQVKVKFNDRGPNCYLHTGSRMIKLDEEMIGMIDDIDIMNIDLDIRPYDWTLDDGKSGRTAYLQSVKVTQRVDRFAADMDGDLPPF
jgi:hypothetical protein